MRAENKCVTPPFPPHLASGKRAGLTESRVVRAHLPSDMINNARGGGDRIAYEAAASGVPVLASNPAYSNLLDPDLFFERDDPAQLASRLAQIASLSPAERDAIGRRLRERVEQRHSVDTWAIGLLRAAGLSSRICQIEGATPVASVASSVLSR